MSVYTILCSAWNTGITHIDWKRGLVFPRCKAKSDRQDCNNYRGVVMLSVLGKVFAWIILHGVRHHLLEHQCLEQSGLTPKKSTIDRVLAPLGPHRTHTRVLAGAVDLCKALQPILISAKHSIQSIGMPSGGLSVFVVCHLS